MIYSLSQMLPYGVLAGRISGPEMAGETFVDEDYRGRSGAFITRRKCPSTPQRNPQRAQIAGRDTLHSGCWLPRTVDGRLAFHQYIRSNPIRRGWKGHRH